MLVPADGIAGVRKVVLDAVLTAGPNSCPPMVVGVGLGGTMEMAAICAKSAAARDLESRNPDPRYAAFEDELLELINKTGVGPQAWAGRPRPLKGACGWAPTHCFAACGRQHQLPRGAPRRSRFIRRAPCLTQ